MTYHWNTAADQRHHLCFFCIPHSLQPFFPRGHSTAGMAEHKDLSVGLPFYTPILLCFQPFGLRDGASLRGCGVPFPAGSMVDAAAMRRCSRFAAEHRCYEQISFCLRYRGFYCFGRWVSSLVVTLIDTTQKPCFAVLLLSLIAVHIVSLWF